MNTEELKTFLILANTKNFRITSERLFCSPSTISARIQSLEQELGERLFERDNKSVRITDSGRIFYTYASEMLHLWDASKANVTVGNSYRTQVAIAAPTSFWDTELLQVIRDFMRTDSSVAYNLVVCHSIHVLEGLANGTFDFGISLLKSRHPNLESVVLHVDKPYFLVASPSVALPDDFVLTPRTIRQVPFCFMHHTAQADNWLEENYRCGSYLLELENTPLFIRLLLEGLVVGFLPERCALPYIKDGRLLSYPYLFSDALRDTIYAVYHKHDEEKVGSLLQALNAAPAAQ